MRIYKPKNMSDFSAKIAEYFRAIRDILIEKGWREQKDFRNQHKNLTVVELDKFTIVISDETKEHHGNVSLDIFNAEGNLVDSAVLFHIIDNKRPKSIVGTRIVLDDEIIDKKTAFESMPSRSGESGR